jgi:hypothetical protein
MSELENVQSAEGSLEQSHEATTKSNNVQTTAINESGGNQILQHDNTIESVNSNLPYAQKYQTYQQPPIKVKKSNSFNFLSIALIVLVILLGVFAGYETYSAFNLSKIAATNKADYQKEIKLVNSFKTQNDNLNTDISNLNVKYTNLETELSKTAAGKAALQTANNTLQTQNTQLDKKATDAEQQMIKAQADLKAKLAELDTANAQLTSVNGDLVAKKVELDKANRGISKFADLQNLYITFKKYKDDFTGYFSDSITKINFYMSSGNNSYKNAANLDLDNADIAYQKMEDINVQMNTIFDLIKSGNY